jgi:hypothetical protein
MVNRDATILFRAIELAESGYHIDCLTIESELVNEGYGEAADLLKNERLRSGLRTICHKHWHPDRAPADNNNIVDFGAAMRAGKP